MYKVLPTDPFITEMDPVLKVWLYEQWIGDHRDDAELAKNHAYLLGSFWNPEAVKQLMNDNVHESTDEEYEESLRMVRDTNIKMLDLGNKKTGRKRKRRNLKDKQG
jgi:hypothetical protein